MKLGARDFLAKPVEHQDLVRLVKRSLEYRSRFADLTLGSNGATVTGDEDLPDLSD